MLSVHNFGINYWCSGLLPYRCSTEFECRVGVVDGTLVLATMSIKMMVLEADLLHITAKLHMCSVQDCTSGLGQSANFTENLFLIILPNQAAPALI